MRDTATFTRRTAAVLGAAALAALAIAGTSAAAGTARPQAYATHQRPSLRPAAVPGPQRPMLSGPRQPGLVPRPVPPAVPSAAMAALGGIGQPPLADRSLGAVSCPTASNCLAVGGDDAGLAVGSWQGGAWHELAPIMPANADPAYSQLSAVACPLADRCVVVGHYTITTGHFNTYTLAETWDGTRWQVLNTRSPSGDDHLSGLWCGSPTDCIAVGGDRGLGGSHLTLAEVWHGGQWVTMTTPTPAGTGYNTFLSGVSCTSASWCMAVGQYDSHGTLTLTERWNGHIWQIVPAPGGGLSAVSCLTPSACLAVGGSLAESWDGKTWQVVSPPGPAGLSLAGVTCTTVSHCVAVGNAGGAPVAETWNGARWAQDQVPSPASGGGLSGVSCAGAGHCLAVGGNLAEQWNGTAWRIVRLGRLDSLSGVSCRLITACLTVGSYLNSIDNHVPLAEAGAGTSWRLLPPPAGFISGLGAVSCAAATTCMAVAGSVGESWNGTSWRVSQLPMSAGGLACPSAVACLAVGGDLAASWNGTSWRLLHPAIPAGSNATTLSSVSCTGATSCMAVGQYFTDPHDSYGINLAEEWNGTSWRILRVPEPGQNNYLSAVACRTLSDCTAVGDDNNSTDTFYPFAEHWNGQAWRTQPIAGSDRYLVSVSCAATSRCMATGFYSLVPGYLWSVYQPISEQWDGLAWRAVSVGVSAASLSAVSCTHPAACVAVGQWDNGPALAVQWDGTRWLKLPIKSP